MDFAFRPARRIAGIRVYSLAFAASRCVVNSIELGRAVYGPAVAPYIVGAAVSRFLVALGDYAPWPVLRDALINAGWMLTAGCLIVLVGEFIAQTRNHNRILAREDAETRLIAPPEPEAAPVAPKVPFPPYRFVQFAWDWYEAHGKFPTVRQCEESKDHFAHSLVQLWYQQMVSAGAIVNRVEGQSAGDPMWSREKCEKAAITDNTAYQA